MTSAADQNARTVDVADQECNAEIMPVAVVGNHRRKCADEVEDEKADDEVVPSGCVLSPESSTTISLNEEEHEGECEHDETQHTDETGKEDVLTVKVRFRENLIHEEALDEHPDNSGAD